MSKSKSQTATVVAAAVGAALAGSATAGSVAAASTPAPAKSDGSDVKSVPGVRVVSRPETWRRAGYEFTAEPREIPLSQLTDEQLALLRGEKNLVVVDCEIAVAE